MSLQNPKSKKWSKIVAASSDRVTNRTLQLYRTISKNSTSIAECETMKVAVPNTISDQEFSSQQTEELNQSYIYDDKVFAEALKDINSELETLQSLYNSQWFTDIRTSIDKNRNHVACAEMCTNASITDQLPGETSSKTDLRHSKYRQNTPIMQNSTAVKPTAVFEQLQSALKREVDELNRLHEIVPPEAEKQFGDDMNVDKSVVEIPAVGYVATPADALAAVVNHRSEKAVNTMNVISEERKEENVKKDTQNEFSGFDNKRLYNNFTQMLCEVDKITNELTEFECETFNDAIYAMKEKIQNKEKVACKTSAALTMPESRCSLSISKVRSVLQRSSEKRSLGSLHNSAKINAQETDSKAGMYKMPDSTTLCNSRLPKKLRNTPTDKQKKLGADSLNWREMPEKKKVTTNHSFQFTKQKSSTYSISGDTPQADSEIDLPLEVCPLQVNHSLRLVPKHYAANKISTKSCPKRFRPVALK